MKTLFRTFKFATLAILISTGFLSGQIAESNSDETVSMKSQILSYYDCWNKGTVDAIDEILSEEYIRYEDGNFRQSHIGRETIKESIHSINCAYSELKISITDLFISGDRVTTVWRLTGIQTGEMGEIAPTGKQVDVSGVLISRISNGRIVEEWSFFNQLNLWTQLGYTLIPQKQHTASTSQTTGEVIINGSALSAEQVMELENRYRVKAQPGNYWYDAISGLYGIVGQASAGFMYPDHNFGTLDRNVSNGYTGVIVNGRELPQAEWAVWSQVLGYWINPGSYWFDSKGNAGYEGNPIPLVNFYTAARENAYRGNAGGGDRFWSTRFSAGNSYAGNQTGYVSLPGGGIVGYGD